MLAWKWFPLVALAACIAEIVFCLQIVARVPYTEIDWVAYMQEVEGVVNGTYDYVELRGDTGPLVYPGGFVYIFKALYWFTDRGTDILLAQHVWAGLYVATLAVVLYVYWRARPCPPWMAIFLLLSKRMHSIFVLRLFNDCVAMFLLYAALALFLNRRWLLGCILYSAAVSVKMNVLLFAPGLFILLLQAKGLAGAVAHIGACAVVQLVAGLEFLLANPVSYLSRAFELSRVFTYKWTVNLKFLPADVFVDKRLALGLLLLHVASLWLVMQRLSAREGGFFRLLTRERPAKASLSARHIVFAFAATNFVGIVFARTLHYQFYSWYFHLLPALFGLANLGPLRATASFLAIELAFNIYPATWWSSGLLQIAHLSLLFSVVFPSKSTPNRLSSLKAE